MKLHVHAKPGSKRPRIEETTDLFNKSGERHFLVAVREPAKESKANRAIEAALAEHFNVPKSRVRIVNGAAARDKIVEIL